MGQFFGLPRCPMIKVLRACLRQSSSVGRVASSRVVSRTWLFLMGTSRSRRRIEIYERLRLKLGVVW